MNLTEKEYNTIIDILKEELVPAMGCTEPIAIAYASAKAREVLDEEPTDIEVFASGNIIKNVKSVIVPNSGNMKGLETAACIGAFYGNADKELQVISSVTKEEAKELKERMNDFSVHAHSLDSDHVLDILIEMTGKNHHASVRIQDDHTNIVEIKKDGEVIFYKEPVVETEEKDELDYSVITVENIIDFAENAILSDVEEILQRQIDFNMTIAEEGLKGAYGASIGKTILKRGDNVRNLAVSYAAAASDARMSGCDLPVVINSGSGNQGITTSVPVIIYSRYYRKTKEEMLRALLVSNLVTLHLKSGIGKLSAYCGAVSAGVGAGAGIAYLLTKERRVVEHEIVNSIAVTSGMVCDGAKASCAAKIAMAIESGILGFEMYEQGNEFYAGDGLVSKGVENTIKNIAALGHDGMKETDKKIIEIMT